uniref:Uncharacterized protein n=1 Tax=Anguilla anguilla TaxID=7936 RepID=A0A0E9T7J8_ANGAN
MTKPNNSIHFTMKNLYSVITMR